jgi:hypothetical protein
VERRRLKLGMKVGIRPANRKPSLNLRTAVLIGLISPPGYRQKRAIVKYEDTGERVEPPLSRLAPLPRP